MVWGSGALGTDELSAYARNYPFLVGNNILELSDTSAQWRVSGSWASGTDITDSSGPGRLAYDRRSKLQTMPTSAGLGAATTVYLIFDMTGLSSQAGEFDTIGIIGHNFNSLADLDSVTVQIDNASNFATATTIFTWSSSLTSSSKRLFTTLPTDGVNTPARFNSVDFLRVGFTASAGFSVVPKVGEVWCGRRQQLTMKGQLPFPDRPLRSESATFRSESGEMTRHALYSGASDRSILFNLGARTIGSLDPETSLRNFQDQIQYGQKSFLYIEDPTTVDSNRRAWHMMLDPPEFAFSQLDVFEEEVEMSMVELPPFVVTEV